LELGVSQRRKSRLTARFRSNLAILPAQLSGPNRHTPASDTAYLTDVLARINDHPNKRLDDLLPWNWQPLSA
jgi:hypothetical protein